MIRLLLWVTLLLTPLGVGSAGEVFPGVCFPKVEESHFQQRGKKSGVVYIGTGSFISERLVLTCYHNVRDFVQGKSRIVVEDENGHVYTNVVIIKSDKVNDLSLLKVVDVHIVEHGVIPIQKENVWYQGPVVNHGYWGEKRRYFTSSGNTDGRFYGPSKNNTTRSLFTHTGEVYQGMSGGPCLNTLGEIVGVNVASDGDRGFTVGIPWIHKLIQ